MCKGPELRKFLTRLRNLKKTNRAEIQSVGCKISGDEAAEGPSGSGP